MGGRSGRGHGVEVALPDGRRLRSHVLGLGYFDFSSGKSAVIAVLKNSAGQWHPPNQVVYPGAFTDVRCAYTRAGLG